MIAPFDWWLLIVGLAAGAGLAWLVLADLRRREDDLDARERADEAAWIAATLEAQGRGLPEDLVDDVLSLHRWYLREPPRFDGGDDRYEGDPGSDQAWPEAADPTADRADARAD